MRIDNTRARPSTRDTQPSLQGQPVSSSRQRHRTISSSSDADSTTAIWGSPEESRISNSPDILPSMTQEECTQPYSNYQPSIGFQQNVVPQSPSWQTSPVQQQAYYQTYTTSNPGPSLTTTSGQGDSTDYTSTESSEDEHVDELRSPYWGSRRQFRDALASASTRSDINFAPRRRSHYQPASRSAVDETTANPSLMTERPSSSRHRRPSSNTTNTAAGSSRPPRIGGPVLPSPADRLPQHMVAPIHSHPFRPWTPIPPPSVLNAPAYDFSQVIYPSQSYAGYGQSGPSEYQYSTGGAPPNIEAIRPRIQLGINQSNQERGPVGSDSGIHMSGISAGYLQQPHGQRESTPHTLVNASQNAIPRWMPTPLLGSHTTQSASRSPVSHQQVAARGAQRQSETSPQLGDVNTEAGRSVLPTGHIEQPSGQRGGNPSPLRTEAYGTSGQGREPPRGMRRRRQQD
ncbi:uncharacterized protein FFB20_00815 [Fusarium fujikuroi]|uniref:Uncharacterized protein n=1 Tax=Gibberella fujikuroi (strain CBS 195.34 / IMI 58289 / NRRL A-6831) TaxID=1279085 RepID=S0ELE3_GIBF5|nr:uncharacterized protein FFUJ_11902 [Fusarium fujikuroi IMI 58289]SCN64598.1 uncharacterized protein FFB20_00815 [Fusarium fujikuroi]CCT75858.1 uncharacterized protein FFUJ_11902 [Fusarium fujikuroi IMI 58289]SCN70698.1 uncharacterized protein FFE2_02080 [Fusarium fujikuroi]SCO14620.1 uncharacterized protein FFM5_10906 [Fusarium fujikuroi]SCO14738.1 uncharacterized protein FFC1_12254 [Fusarium fujikuroi]